MKKRNQVFLLVFLIILLIAVNYNFLDSKLSGFLIGNDIEYAKVIRIIDGDTIVVENGTHIRLLGINTPEKNEFYYQEAKDSLNNLISNKTIKLEYGKDKTDLYGRTLAYIFLDDKNVNLEIVENGLANPYIYDIDKYTQSIRNAWINCIKENKNLCEKSKDKCADCIELKELDVKSQTLILYNSCNFQCSLKDWTIKDEGRKKFVFPDFTLDNKKEISVIVERENRTDTENVLFWKRSDYVWTSGGDTLFLRDKEGRLVLWKGY